MCCTPSVWIPVKTRKCGWQYKWNNDWPQLVAVIKCVPTKVSVHVRCYWSTQHFHSCCQPQSQFINGGKQAWIYDWQFAYFKRKRSCQSKLTIVSWKSNCRLFFKQHPTKVFNWASVQIPDEIDCRYSGERVFLHTWILLFQNNQ